METDTSPEPMERELKRAEWGVICSLLLSAATALFTGGIVYGQVQAQDARITKVESKLDQNSDLITAQAVTVARIDANVQILLEQRKAD